MSQEFTAINLSKYEGHIDDGGVHFTMAGLVCLLIDIAARAHAEGHACQQAASDACGLIEKAKRG